MIAVAAAAATIARILLALGRVAATGAARLGLLENATMRCMTR